MRRATVIAAAAALVVLALAATPLGWRLAVRVIEDRVSEATGLDLEIGSLSGNLLRHATLRDVTLSDSSGLTLLHVDSMSAGYDLIPLAAKRVVVHHARIDGVDLLFAFDRGGEMIGWPLGDPGSSATGSGPRAPPGDWSIEIGSISASSLSAVVRDSGSGASVLLDGVVITGRGGPGAFDARLRGSLAVDAALLRRPVSAAFAGRVSGSGSRVVIDSLSVSSEIVRLDSRLVVDLPPASGQGGAGTGTSAPEGELLGKRGLAAGARGGSGGESHRPSGGSGKPILEGQLTGAIVLSSLGEAIGVSGLEGVVEAGATVWGPADSLGYGVNLASAGMTVSGLDVGAIQVVLSGAGRGVEIEEASAEFLGGTVSCWGGLEVLGGEDDRRLKYSLRVNASDIDLSRVERTLPGAASGVRGRAALALSLDGSSPGLDEVLAGADLEVSGLEVGTLVIGDVSASAGVARGLLRARGNALGCVLDAEGSLGDAGVDSLELLLEVPDLSAIARVFGAPKLAGSGLVAATVDARDPAGLSAEAHFPSVCVRGMEVGPVALYLWGADAGISARFEAFEGTLRGSWMTKEGGAFAARATADSLNLSPPLALLIPDCGNLGGVLSGTFAVSRGASGRMAVGGLVTDIRLTSQGQVFASEAPFRFAAAKDSLYLSDMTMRGAAVAVSLSGRVDPRADSSLNVAFSDLDLRVLEDLVRGPAHPPRLRGIAEGRITLSGSLRDPRLSSFFAAEDLSYADLRLGSITAQADSDSNDVRFSIECSGTGSGSLRADGVLPVEQDERLIMKADGTRPFSLCIVCSEFETRFGRGFLAHVKGEKSLIADGAFALSGYVDSLDTLEGSGAFGALSARFGEATFSVLDTLLIDLAGSRLNVGPAEIAIARRGALGSEEGGLVEVAGGVGRGGLLEFGVSGTGVDLGQLVKVFGPAGGARFGGRLDFSADVGGSAAEPAVDFEWMIESPVLYGFGFDGCVGSGRVEPGILQLEDARFELGGGVLRASGEMPVAMGGVISALPRLDLHVVANGLELGGLTELPPGLRSLKGRLSLDVRVSGDTAAPTLDGWGRMRNGEARFYGLEQPVRDVRLDFAAADGVIETMLASARLGRGRIDISGLGEVRGADRTAFWLTADLSHVEVSLPDAMEGRFGGALIWAGSPTASHLSGDVNVEKLDVIYRLGLLDMIVRRPAPATVRSTQSFLSRTSLDIAIAIEDEVRVENDLVRLGMAGGFRIGGSAVWPVLSGSIHAAGGSFRYLENEFEIEALSISFTDPRRRDPYVDLLGVADVVSKSGEHYVVALSFKGFAFDAVPELTASPPLSEPDIMALLTFGETVGAMMAVGDQTGSSGRSFNELARGAFVSALFGLAEQAAARALRLDTLSLDREALASGDIVGSDVTVEKRFGSRVEVIYATDVGRFSEQRVQLALELADWLSLETESDQDGNHAVDLKWHLRFR